MQARIRAPPILKLHTTKIPAPRRQQKNLPYAGIRSYRMKKEKSRITRDFSFCEVLEITNVRHRGSRRNRQAQRGNQDIVYVAHDTDSLPQRRPPRSIPSRSPDERSPGDSEVMGATSVGAWSVSAARTGRCRASSTTLPAMVRRTALLAALAAGALAAAPARAEPLPLRVDYQAVPGCPAEDVFVDEIRWRTPLARAGPRTSRRPAASRAAPSRGVPARGSRSSPASRPRAASSTPRPSPGARSPAWIP